MTTPIGIVTCLPAVDVDELVACVEVLVQEHLTTFACDTTNLTELRRVFGARATFGAMGVADVDQLGDAVQAGADFVLADAADEQMATYAAGAGATWFAPALTPLEVRAVLDLGATGALLWPAEVVGHAMAGHLARIGLMDRVVPMGGVGAFAAGEWMKHGAPAACVDQMLLGDAPTGGDLGQLRDRCTSFRKAATQARATSED
ncbi:hypothetical protein [uncultured Tessaracoccus sp.]|uniref:hypothetical protein n=1 Tax=uncultured Tessaracoccus sp. TaxID=905023 RepID=UPI0025D8B335|nr:hypothetical protein [uncultured Tessaracoccus sp.]